jgi:hypothetical protein
VAGFHAEPRDLPGLLTGLGKKAVDFLFMG